MRDGTPKPKPRRGGIVSYRGVEDRRILIDKMVSNGTAILNTLPHSFLAENRPFKKKTEKLPSSTFCCNFAA